MRFIRHYRSMLVFAVFLVVCSVMVIRQFHANQHQHRELREAFILLYSKGYRPQAERLYNRLVQQLEDLPNHLLLDDYQRTLTLVDPHKGQKENLIWCYHWTVSNEIEKRSWATLDRALRLANEE